MQDFFDKNLLQSIVSGIIIMFLSILLGSKVKTPKTSGKAWKVVVIIGWIIILSGFYEMIVSTQTGIFRASYFFFGIFISIIGWAITKVGKFFIWWHH